MTGRDARSFAAALMVVLALALVGAAQAQEKTIWVEPGKNVDVYWEINLAGTVYLAADIDGAPACVDYWWITWPFQRVEQLGRHCGRVTFDLPGLGSFAIGGKLRVGGASARTRIQGTADEEVARKFPKISF